MVCGRNSSYGVKASSVAHLPCVGHIVSSSGIAGVASCANESDKQEDMLHIERCEHCPGRLRTMSKFPAYN